MSNLVFPNNIPGITWDNVRTPQWRTNVQQAISGKASAYSYQQYPLYEWQLKFEYLDNRPAASSDQLRALMGFFNALRGRYDTFLYSDPVYNSVTAEPFGTGDGTTTVFPLIATFQNPGGPGIAELIQNFNGAPQIYKSGVLQTGGGVNYTLGPTGIVTFNSAPAAAAPLTWTGGFFYRCRFSDDSLSFTQFMQYMWQTATLKFASVLL